MSKVIRFLMGVLILLTLFWIGFMAGVVVTSIKDGRVTQYELLDEAVVLIEEYFMGDLPDSLVLQRGMIHGMVAKLEDPYTFYVEPAANELQTDQLVGYYGGIEAYIHRDEDGSIYLVPFSGGEVEAAGIEETDRLIAIDGVIIEPEMDLSTLESMIRGETGSVIVLTFAARTPGGDSIEIELIRKNFDIPSVTGYLVPDHEEIAVLVIERFSDMTLREVRREYDYLVDQGAQGLILDLRGNSGGLLDASIEVARFFQAHGLVMTERQIGDVEREHYVEEPGAGSEILLVVLVDEGTASGAEVLAASISDNARGLLVGTQTYGKGSVQTILPLSDDSSLHITMARWMRPNGTSLDGIGIQPDVLVIDSEDQHAAIFEVGLQTLQDQLGISE
ncbi:MAG: hypothetical protein GTO18_02635 [Anaerolineales bacterium]|nr:hypothetical protein [Anaerolineales bacterium]